MDTVKVKMLVAYRHTTGRLAKGDVLELPEKVATRWVDSKIAQRVAADPPKTDKPKSKTASKQEAKEVE